MVILKAVRVCTTLRANGAAVVHDFFIQDGGAERVALELAALLPDAPVYTTFFDRDRFGDRLAADRVRTWPLQRLLGPTPSFRSLLPLYPAYFSALRVPGALVISSSVAFAKAVRTSRRSLHVSYIHTPMRYAWDLDRYLRGSSTGLAGRLAARSLRPILQRWDRTMAQHPDVLVANSETVRGRIARLWGRSSELIHPPVDVGAIPLSLRDDGFFLVAARLLAYRRIDLAVKAATRLGRELVVVGEGPEEGALRRTAGPSVRFMGHLPRKELVDLFGRCHAYLVPGVEDFGIAPVEAMAAGKPVIAFAEGGALETVVEDRTGVFFRQPTPTALAEAIERLEGLSFDREVIRAQAERFDSSIFRAHWRQLLHNCGAARHLAESRDP